MAQYTEDQLIEMALDKGLTGDDALDFVQAGLKAPVSPAPAAPAASATPTAREPMVSLAAPPRRQAPAVDAAADAMPVSRPAAPAAVPPPRDVVSKGGETELVADMDANRARIAQLKQRRGAEMATARAAQPVSSAQQKQELMQLLRDVRENNQQVEAEKRAQSVEKTLREVLGPSTGGALLGGIKPTSGLTVREGIARAGQAGYFTPGQTIVPQMGAVGPIPQQSMGKGLGTMLGVAAGLEAGVRLAPEMVRRLPDLFAPSEEELGQQADAMLQRQQLRDAQQKKDAERAAAMPPPTETEKYFIKAAQKAKEDYEVAVPGYLSAVERVEKQPMVTLPGGKEVSVPNFKTLASTGGLPTTIPKYVRDVLRQSPDLSSSYIKDPAEFRHTAFAKSLSDNTVPPYQQVADIISPDDYKKMLRISGISRPDDLRTLMQTDRSVRLPNAAQAGLLYEMRTFENFRSMLDEAAR
jgi:hypothetical protein